MSTSKKAKRRAAAVRRKIIKQDANMDMTALLSNDSPAEATKTKVTMRRYRTILEEVQEHGHELTDEDIAIIQSSPFLKIKHA